MSNGRVVIASLALSAAGLVGIVGYEGYSETAITPIEGDVLTIGFGTTEGVKAGDRITPPKALERALKDVRKFEGALKACVTVPLHQYEYDAYVSLAYNIGPGKERVADGFCWLKRGGNSTLVKKLNAGDYQGACDEILKWRKYQGLDCAAPENERLCGGLVTRRQSEYRKCMGKAE